MASYDQGYEDDRFENAVSQNFHCPICLNVLKDPVMCQRNQHCFCRPCITRHLKNSQTCPTCMETLTVETLKPAPRIYQVCLSELTIRCDYFNRGCREFVQLGNLETHVKNCGFSPVVCSNEGCLVEINKQDRTHHETEACQFRKVKCHECGELRKDIDEMKIELTAVKNEMQLNFTALNKEIKAIAANSKAVSEKLNDIDNKLYLKEIKDKPAFLPEQTQQSVHDIHARREKMKEMAEGNHGIIIAGGFEILGSSNSVELFNLPKKKWEPLEPMKEYRFEATSFVFQNQMIVGGGYTRGRRSNTMERININPVMKSEPWFDFPAKLPTRLDGPSSVVYDHRQIMIGGHDGRKCSNSIHEVLLLAPYTCKLLTTMPQPRCLHGAQLFDDKILICGGTNSADHNNIDSVIMYDISKNKCKQMSPLPYAVSEMATVSWGDNVIVIGGVDQHSNALDTVVIYNVKTEKSHMLPAMKSKRRACVAVVVDNTIVVMGGSNERGNCLDSVESFSFDRYSWEDLPPMNRARRSATAVAW